MSLLEDKQLFQAFLKQAQDKGDAEHEAMFSAAIKAIDEELQAPDPQAFKLSREGAAAARSIQPRADQRDPTKLYEALKAQYLGAKTPLDRMGALNLMRSMEAELPFSLANDLNRLWALEGSEEGRLAREGAQLARSIQPRGKDGLAL
jgi:hypothetical protein